VPRAVDPRHREEPGFFLGRQRVDPEGRVVPVPEVAADACGGVRLVKAVLDHLVEELTDGRDDVSHEASAPSLRQEVDDEVRDIRAGDLGDELRAEARVHVGAQGAANGAGRRPVEAGPLPKDEAAVQTLGRFHA
jgi:hypothetical protein